MKAPHSGPSGVAGCVRHGLLTTDSRLCAHPPPSPPAGTFGAMLNAKTSGPISIFGEDDVEANLACEPRNLYYRQCFSEWAGRARRHVRPQVTARCLAPRAGAGSRAGAADLTPSPRPPPSLPPPPARSPQRAHGRPHRHRRDGGGAGHDVLLLPAGVLQVLQQQGGRQPLGHVQPLLPVDAVHRPPRRGQRRAVVDERAQVGGGEQELALRAQPHAQRAGEKRVARCRPRRLDDGPRFRAPRAWSLGTARPCSAPHSWRWRTGCTICDARFTSRLPPPPPPPPSSQQSMRLSKSESAGSASPALGGAGVPPPTVGGAGMPPPKVGGAVTEASV